MGSQRERETAFYAEILGRDFIKITMRIYVPLRKKNGETSFQANFFSRFHLLSKVKNMTQLLTLTERKQEGFIFSRKLDTNISVRT